MKDLFATGILPRRRAFSIWRPSLQKPQDRENRFRGGLPSKTERYIYFLYLQERQDRQICMKTAKTACARDFAAFMRAPRTIFGRALQLERRTLFSRVQPFAMKKEPGLRP
jgi:hypothetical protein